MSNMIELAKRKADALTTAVTTDSRWDLQNELMCQVFGFTLYGFLFGVGRLSCFMDVEEIQKVAIDQLTKLGIGVGYAAEMTWEAHRIVTAKGDKSLHAQLISVGHSHFTAEDLKDIVNSVFANTEKIRMSMS